MKELQDKIVKCIKLLSDITKLKVKDDFIQDKLHQISEQEIEFKKFAVDYKLKMSTHADDLIRFAESCEGDNISSDVLLESLRKLNDDKLNENKTDILSQIVNVKNSLDEIVYEVAEYNKKITEGHTEWNNKIHKADQDTEEATTLAKTSLMIVGIGTIAASAVVPFTAGASLALVIPAKAIITLGMSLIFQGTGTATISSAVAGVSSIHKCVLHNELKDVKGQISQLLREMEQVLNDINEIIKHCEFHFKKQIAEIEEVENIVCVIKKLDDKELVKPIARTISTRARKNSISYNVDVQIRNLVFDTCNK